MKEFLATNGSFFEVLPIVVEVFRALSEVLLGDVLHQVNTIVTAPLIFKFKEIA
jgi:hypothetical protein